MTAPNDKRKNSNDATDAYVVPDPVKTKRKTASKKSKVEKSVEKPNGNGIGAKMVVPLVAADDGFNESLTDKSLDISTRTNGTCEEVNTLSDIV